MAINKSSIIYLMRSLDVGCDSGIRSSRKTDSTSFSHDWMDGNRRKTLKVCWSHYFLFFP